MTKSINVAVPLLDTTLMEVATMFSDAVITHIPAMADDILNAKASGFRSMSFGYNLMTQRYDVTVYYRLDCRTVYHTISAGCPATGVASLMLAIATMASKNNTILARLTGDIEFKYMLDEANSEDDDAIPAHLF